VWVHPLSKGIDDLPKQAATRGPLTSEKKLTPTMVM
jgi:hypothetical protein